MTYTILMGWSAANAKSAEKLDKGGAAKGDDTKKPADPKTKPDTKIEDKKATSDDAKKFLP